MDKITGIHAVREALEAGRPLEHVLIAKGRQDTRVEEIVQLARRNGVPVRFEERSQVDRSAGSRDHQGVMAVGAARAATSLEDIVASANKNLKQAGLIVLLDGVEDPHNLGAVIRTALAAGGGIDGHGGAGVGGSAGAFAGGESDEPGARDGRVEGDGLLACGT